LDNRDDAIARAKISAEPPGVKGTTNRMGRLGYAEVRASVLADCAATAGETSDNSNTQSIKRMQFPSCLAKAVSINY